MPVTIRDVEAARDVIAPFIHRTPLLSSRSLGDRIGASAWLKAESLQVTGSFKARGAAYAVSRLPADARTRGVVTLSGGNAGQAVAWAARRAGIPAVIVMPESAARVNVDAIRAYGADIRFAPDVTQLQPIVRELQAAGRYVVHPFDDEAVIAGQGTVGLEILDDLPGVDVIVAGVGGGGLIGGIAVAAAARRPGVRVVGVEAAGALAMKRSLEAGRPVSIDAVRTVAVGLGAPFAGQHTFPLVRDLVEDIAVVSDDEILDAVRFLAARARLFVEPAGAAPVAALLQGRVRVRAGEQVVAVLSGANADLARMAEWLAG